MEVDTPYPMEVDTPYPMEVDTPYPMEVDRPSGSRLDTAYPSVGYGVLGFLGARIRRIFLDGYGVLVFRIVIFKISSFKLQNARLLLSFTNYSIITAILKYKRLMMQADELYKFSGGTLKKVLDEIHHRVLDFHLGYNDEMSKRKWTAIHRKSS
ncbi:hypothetical protein Tco_1014563 [Tanacetum coccineum]